MWSSEYLEYIESEQWQKRRSQYLGKHPRRCAACNCGGRNLHLHHLSYLNMGNEPDEDLIPLCEAHHNRVHELHRLRGGSLRRVTLEFVSECPKREKGPKRTKPISDFVPRNRRGAWIDNEGRLHSSEQ